MVIRGLRILIPTLLLLASTGRPTFVAYDAMTYLVFFPPDDPLGRRYEWWTGVTVPR